MYSLKHGNAFAFHASLLFFCAIFVICCSDDGNKATDHRQQPYLTLADTTACPLVKVNAERLPELNIPRAGHNMFYAGDELTVVGGHTIGFKPTATAEYYKDDQWHQLPTEYPHDNGLAVPLTAGKVLLAGGHSEPLGIGQSYLVESYDPASHTCTGFSSLYTKRTLAQGIELDSGRVVIAGNHFHHDAIELFDGKKTFPPSPPSGWCMSMARHPLLPRAVRRHGCGSSWQWHSSLLSRTLLSIGDTRLLQRVGPTARLQPP